MHGCGSGSALIVNAEVDSMGGVVNGGVGIGIKTSPRQAAIERAQAELRQEYDVREEKRRELDFLEKGGNPLDFKFGNATSVSVQSTSLTDHHTEHFVTSEVKGSFVLTASPHGDSVESSGRPGAPIVCDPNSADNFVDENEILEGERNVKHSRRTNVAPSEHSSQMDGTQIAKESEDSAIVRPYARRNRSRPNRDGARSSSTDIAQSSVGHGSFLKVHGALRNLKGQIPETNSQDRTIPSFSNPKSTTSNGDMASQIAITQSNMELDGNLAVDTTSSPCKVGAPEDRLNVLDTSILSENQCNRLSDIDAQKRSCDLASVECDQISGKEQVFAAASDFTPGADSAQPENVVGSAKLNGVDDLKRDGDEGKNTNCSIGKGLDSESSCTQNGLCVNANNESDLCINGKTNDTEEILFKPLSKSEAMPNFVDAEMVNEKNDIKFTDEGALIKEGKDTVNEKHSGCDSFLKVDGEVQKNSELNHELNCSSNFRRVEHIDHAASHADKELCTVLADVSNSNKEIISTAGPDGCVELSMQGPCETALLEKNSAVVPGPQSCSGSQLLVADKDHEDFILEEARLVKRIAELSVGVVPLESRRKSQWDFVLEEMEWLANDFAQERLWKMTAAAQICHRVAFTSRLRVEEKKQCWKLRRVACDLANAVMQFWHSVEILMKREDQCTNLKHDLRRFGADEICKNKFGELDKEKCREFEIHNLGEHCASPLQGYAVRFLKCNNSIVPSLQAEAPSTPDRVTDWGCIGISWEDHLTEESLFYAVPSGAMEAYRISIESHLVQCERTGISMQEEVDTSMYDSAAEFGYRENRYDEEEGETSTYYLHGAFDGNRSTKHDQKRKNLMKRNSLRSYELGVDLTYGHHAAASQQNSVIGKRPASNLHVGSIPTKRVRSSASRQRFVSPFNAGAIPTPAKTDASSGDTSSFQDDQSTLHGGSQIQKCIEVESVGHFEKQLPYDSAETTIKPKKKKKAKNLIFDQGWQLDSIIHKEQRDHSKKRLENHHFVSNGTSGLLYGQHPAKKLKLMKQSLGGTLENMSPIMGSIPSPAASQMSHMPSTSKSMKTIGNKDRGGRKPRLKVIVGQPGSGCPWSLFEDQALVVLVHDMGPNWELVSDAINSTLQFKCMFRKPVECKERHKFLMDKGAGDGAESADDSGSSQSYPSTLPGIPKGSARQLFQRLQGPMEEDTLKSHFEKIITIGKKYHYRRTQNDNMDPKQIVPIHNSHLAALDQVPTSPDGGSLTPLDLCDTTVSSPETLRNGYPSSHATGVPMSNQSTVGSVLPTSGENSSLQASPSIVLGNNSSPSGPLNTSIRDGRYSISITSLPVDEQQRLHYNKMLSNRNLQQSNLPVSGALSGADRVVRVVPGGNTVGMMPRMNKSMPLPRQGFQGMASSPLLNSTSMLSTGMVGMANPVSMQPGSSSSQGNSMMRSRDGLQMVRTGSSGNNSEHQRKMLVPELQLQVSQGTSQGVPAFSGLSSPFANQSTTPAVQGYPGHPHQSHAMSNPHHPHLQGANHSTGSPQQSYAIRLENDRQMPQRLLQQQQKQQLAASGAPMPLVTSQPQLPMSSSSMQNSSQIQPQTSTQPVSLVPLAPSSPVTPVSAQQQLQKHTLSHHGINRNSQTVASGLTNLVGKQRPRQPQQHQQFQQAGRVHPQQRQHSHSPQQAKVLKGIGRGNMVVHQNLGIDHSHLNGLSVPPSNQSGEKGEHFMHMMQGQGLYSGTGLSSVQPSKPFTTQCSNHSQSPSKLLSAAAPQSKQMQQMPSHSDASPQGQGSSVSGHTLSAAHQTLPSATIDSNNQQMQPISQIHQKQSGQSAVQRTLQQNRQLNSDLQNKLPTDEGHLEKQPAIASKVPQMSTNAVASMSQACNDSSKKLPDASSAASQWKHSEPPCDTVMTIPASLADSVGNTPLTNLAGNEPMASVNSGLGQRKLPGGMAQHVSAGTQLQQPQLSQSTPPPSQPSSQPLLQPQEQRLPEQRSPRQQLPPQRHSQQLMPLLQSAQGSLYIRPTNSQLE